MKDFNGISAVANDATKHPIVVKYFYNTDHRVQNQDYSIFSLSSWQKAFP